MQEGLRSIASGIEEGVSGDSFMEKDLKESFNLVRNRIFPNFFKVHSDGESKVIFRSYEMMS